MEREITITVTDEEARRIEERVASGEFESATELVHAAVVTFTEGDRQPLSDDLVRQLIEEDEALGGADLTDAEVAERLDRRFRELQAKQTPGA